MNARHKHTTPLRTGVTAASAVKTHYDGAELKPFEGRAGAMDAYKLPSVRGNQVVQPTLYMTRYEEDKK